MQLVWFKKDLRTIDHRPLFEAAKCGPCLCLYIYEPDIIGSDEFDASHLEFINQSLEDLDNSLQALKDRFNSHRQSPRFLALLSPT